MKRLDVSKREHKGKEKRKRGFVYLFSPFPFSLLKKKKGKKTLNIWKEEESEIGKEMYPVKMRTRTRKGIFP